MYVKKNLHLEDSLELLERQPSWKKEKKESKMSLFNSMKQKISGITPTESSAEKSEDRDMRKNEAKRLALLEDIRNIFIELHLSGSLEICTTVAACSFTTETEIDASEDAHHSEDLEEEKKGTLHKGAMKAVRRVRDCS